MTETIRKSSDKREMLAETVRMAWPAVLESFFMALASMIDTMMVASVGSHAVAAVGLTTQPKFIGLTPFMAMNIAVSALTARRRGEGRKNAANEMLMTALCSTLVICAGVTAVCIAFADPIIRLCGSASDTHAEAVSYFRIIMGGTIFNVVSLIINAAQRGSGNTKIAMRTNVTSSVVNVCCNWLLIGGHMGFPALGVKGAALATVAGTVVACAMSAASLFGKDSFVSIPYSIHEKLGPTAEALVSMVRLGINFLVENLVMRIGFVTTAVLAAGLGTRALAAHQVGMNLLTLGFAFGDGMQVAAVALIGRSLGEGNAESARRYGGFAQRIGMFLSVCLAVVILAGGRPLCRLYFSEPDIIEMGVLITRFIIVILVFRISQLIFTGCLRGAGDARYTLAASIISVTLIRSAVTLLLVKGFGWGLSGIWTGILADQFSRLVLNGIRFYKGKWTEVEI